MNAATPRAAIALTSAACVVRSRHQPSRSGCRIAVAYSASAPGDSLRASRPGPGVIPAGYHNSP